MTPQRAVLERNSATTPRRWRALGLLASPVLLSAVIAGVSAQAQSMTGCELGRVTERTAMEYPIQLGSRVVQGTVLLQASFGTDGKNISSKAVSGPQALQFEARAYVAGWRAEPSSDIRQCMIALQYVFEGNEHMCGNRGTIRARAERLSSQNVLIHLTCDAW